MQLKARVVVANSCAPEHCWAQPGLAGAQVAEPLPEQDLRSVIPPMVA